MWHLGRLCLIRGVGLCSVLRRESEMNLTVRRQLDMFSLMGSWKHVKICLADIMLRMAFCSNAFGEMKAQSTDVSSMGRAS